MGGASLIVGGALETVKLLFMLSPDAVGRFECDLLTSFVEFDVSISFDLSNFLDELKI